jgi:hypothetical protein
LSQQMVLLRHIPCTQKKGSGELTERRCVHLLPLFLNLDFGWTNSRLEKRWSDDARFGTGTAGAKCRSAHLRGTRIGCTSGSMRPAVEETYRHFW